MQGKESEQHSQSSLAKKIIKLLYPEKTDIQKNSQPDSRRFQAVFQTGDSNLTLCKNGKNYQFSFKVLNSPEYRKLLSNTPQYSVSLIENNIERSSLINMEDLNRKYGLTKREGEVIEYIYQGLSNKDISLKLKTAEATIKRHIWNIFNKTGAENRTQLIFKLSM